MSDDLSPKMFDYLAEIYRLSDGERVVSDAAPVNDDGFISTSALAELVDVSAPAVNRMVTRLRELALLEHEPYRGVRLTEEGKREALKQLRRHRIAEVFLVKVMGFGWHEVHEEANRMTSALSDMLTTRMFEMSGNPTHCPHGEPIPNAAGSIPTLGDFLLPAAPVNHDYIITRVRTRERDRLEYLAALGLLPGTKVHLLHIAPFNGPMQLKVNKEYRIIGHNLAELIRVKSTDGGP